MTTPDPKSFSWTEISLQIDPLAREALYAFLDDAGCAGLVVTGERDDVIRFYLPAGQNEEEFKQQFDKFWQRIGAIFPNLPSPAIRIDQIENQDWANNWRRFFKPERITPDLYVFPAWEPVPEDIKTHIIRMDPGPAFGTGQHATTRLCLQAMEKIPSLSSKSMLDLGTGSGILSVYGARLNAQRVVGIDTDPEALVWAERNIELNGLSGKIELSGRPVAEWQGSFDLIIANLTRDTILELLPHIEQRLAKEGYLILSGLLQHQEDDIEAGLRTHSLHKEAVSAREDWICVQARKGPQP